MNKEDNFGRLLMLLLITLCICLGLYYLPDNMFGQKIKKVDLLSDLRVKTQSLSMDSLRKQLEQPDTLEIDSVALRDSIIRSTGIDSTALVLRDSLYNIMYSVQGADSLGTHIEDYSVGHIGLKRFFTALKNRETMNRPVRVAFLGDSFIEGDIVVADLRSALQKEFGGRGVGFVPITSVAAQFRPTIEQRSEGWHTWSMLTDHEHGYTLSGMMFEPKGEKVSVSVKTTNRYPELQSASSLKFLYEQNARTRMKLHYNNQPDTINELLPVVSKITQYERKGTFTEATFSFTETEGFRALGVALEDNSGVVVDNYSLRGNSGMILNRLDSSLCRNLTEVRPYDLIILQYGLNVVSDSVLHYGWYSKRMEEAVRHVQVCFPEADILLLGVSDRSHQEEGEFETMPAVLALLHTQRQIARKTGIPFWNTFGAMGGENSMVRYVENNWASKDYTHLSFRGGREIATALFNALLLEKEFYDEADKVVN
ncbi:MULTISPECIES: hypothetical protein [Parabacteroides]|uniref:SGNH hydrolase-type esterase domain-containing protein n=3 Tax=Parabacteroides goldsteinii TaxID=328812 RepID=S0GMT9_9BACT|nr:MULTISPECIES: hypothetical protein [Parabacteroides]EOS20026.1 hypothetical protein C803_00708 [Parabacteroides goldsteinii dnLKV18]KAI4361034.1 hypothetical protein C825_003094 [Parabacteroides sp. ASF519]MBF0763661.1 hypothetical protein [Parabacteroides goldsteinii]MDZ3929579.1 hypothetical protein [Parabacteroides goldsteinii]NBI93669.1 hypothetical protein [Parabacteroides goldsteinii]